MQIVDGYLKRRAEYSLYNLFNIYIYTYVDIIPYIFRNVCTYICVRKKFKCKNLHFKAEKTRLLNIC